MPQLRATKTHTNLKEAFAGESQANRRYLYFGRPTFRAIRMWRACSRTPQGLSRTSAPPPPPLKRSERNYT
jgi:hypothetical protein